MKNKKYFFYFYCLLYNYKQLQKITIYKINSVFIRNLALNTTSLKKETINKINSSNLKQKIKQKTIAFIIVCFNKKLNKK